MGMMRAQIYIYIYTYIYIHIIKKIYRRYLSQTHFDDERVLLQNTNYTWVGSWCNDALPSDGRSWESKFAIDCWVRYLI